MWQFLAWTLNPSACKALDPPPRSHWEIVSSRTSRMLQKKKENRVQEAVSRAKRVLNSAASSFFMYVGLNVNPPPPVEPLARGEGGIKSNLVPPVWGSSHWTPQPPSIHPPPPPDRLKCLELQRQAWRWTHEKRPSRIGVLAQSLTQQPCCHRLSQGLRGKLLIVSRCATTATASKRKGMMGQSNTTLRRIIQPAPRAGGGRGGGGAAAHCPRTP